MTAQVARSAPFVRAPRGYIDADGVARDHARGVILGDNTPGYVWRVPSLPRLLSPQARDVVLITALLGREEPVGASADRRARHEGQRRRG